MAHTIRSLALAAALAVTTLGGATAPVGAQTMDRCMIPDVPTYPGAQRASGNLVGMRGGMAHAVSIWATGDSVAQVIGYYRGQLAASGFADSSAAFGLTMAGSDQTGASGGQAVNSAEFSKDGRQFVYIAATSPGFMLAVACG